MVCSTNRQSARRLKRLSEESGQALIESALAISLLIVLLLGAVEFARYAYAAIEVSNAANAAVDYGASSPAAAADYSGSSGNYSGGIANAAVADAANLSDLKVTSISQSCSCSDTTYTPSDCTDNTTCSSHNTSMLQAISVTTQVTYDPLIYLPGSPTNMVLTGRATRTVKNK
jgi:Flp pilus assembly protein TadG